MLTIYLRRTLNYTFKRSFYSKRYSQCLQSTIHSNVSKYGMFPVVNPQNHALCINPYIQSRRNKYSKNDAKDKQKEPDSDSDSDDEADYEFMDKDAKVVTVKINSLRADLLLKAGLGIARNKVEAIFYQSRIRVNGNNVFKKSLQLNPGDEVDIIRGPSQMNPAFLTVSRIEILSISLLESNISVKLRRFKSLVVENYKDPWKSTDAQE